MCICRIIKEYFGDRRAFSTKVSATFTFISLSLLHVINPINKETNMMYTWFECKIRYEKTMENGMSKKVTEPYLVDALSFTEAEKRIIEEITPFITGEFTVSDIKRANYSELFFSDEDSADRWFRCKIVFITLDEKSGAEKRTSTNMLVQAADLRDAVKKLDEGMKGTMADYQIGSITETMIMDVFPYAEVNDRPEV
jgi:hypothetical protein